MMPAAAATRVDRKEIAMTAWSLARGVRAAGLGWLRPAAGEPLYDRIYDPDVLTAAWKSVRRTDTAGIDGVTVRAFEADWPRNMADLAQCLREHHYHPLPLRRFLLVRPDGRPREIGILALRDRIVQRAVHDVIRPRFEAVASRASFGYRPGLSREDALDRLVDLRNQGYRWVLNADIEAFFDQLDQRRAVATFARIVQDRALADLLREWIEIGMFRATPLPDAANGARAGRRGGIRWPGWGGLVGDHAQRLIIPAGAAIAALTSNRGAADGANGDASLGTIPVRLLAAVEEHLGPTAAALADMRHSSVARSTASALGRVGWRRVGAGAAVLAGVGLLAAGAVPLLAGEPADGAAARGVPQGAILSPLLANAYLADFDRVLERRGLQFVRYADNLAVACQEESDAVRALALVERELARIGLRLNRAKTEIVPYDAGFSLLGERFPLYRGRAPAIAPASDLQAAFAGSTYWKARAAAGFAPAQPVD